MALRYQDACDIARSYDTVKTGLWGLRTTVLTISFPCCVCQKTGSLIDWRWERDEVDYFCSTIQVL